MSSLVFSDRPESRKEVPMDFLTPEEMPSVLTLLCYLNIHAPTQAPVKHYRLLAVLMQLKTIEQLKVILQKLDERNWVFGHEINEYSRTIGLTEIGRDEVARSFRLMGF